MNLAADAGDSGSSCGYSLTKAELMKHILLAALLLLLVFAADAQRVCHTIFDSPAKAQGGVNKSYTSNTTASISTRSGTETNGELRLIRIPVVVHILYNNAQQNISDQQVYSQLEALNKDFRKLNADTQFIPAAFKSIAADCRIEFQLASSDAVGRATTGIIRRYTRIKAFGIDEGIRSTTYGGSDAWDGKYYLNIWVANLTQGIYGYATAPGATATNDGIVISFKAFGTTGTALAPYNKGRTLTHETGHWLGLRHIWGDRDCGNDYIDDTPPQQSSTRGCPSGMRSTCNNGANGDMYMNFMDLTDDACLGMFTAGQCNVMRSQFAQDAARSSLLQSKGLSAPTLPALNAEENMPRSLALHVWPNPAKSFVQLSGSVADGTVVLVQHGNGQTVLRTTVRTGKIYLNGLNAGLYFLKVGMHPVIKLIKVD
ncbi:hypothetical protein HHL16_20905 [Pseudoflavitalea sp. G-6-1-2]|uniref:M43 family zinc metalloprotease n=1 Tax=Pseudoflavitalea sp. G-6-1-2 TaxID=2728841 RepID=UPI00146F437C|nr:M43 family zinc metalloprotease [Pseudoflavitalea sp. G-6-1-2]NML23352.1 hypothetical protein [Pseudoflavitalea sp. G-6-1-2]